MMPFACEMSDVKILHWVVSSFFLSPFFFWGGSISAVKIFNNLVSFMFGNQLVLSSRTAS